MHVREGLKENELIYKYSHYFRLLMFFISYPEELPQNLMLHVKKKVTDFKTYQKRFTSINNIQN